MRLNLIVENNNKRPNAHPMNNRHDENSLMEKNKLSGQCSSIQVDPL